MPASAASSLSLTVRLHCRRPESEEQTEMVVKYCTVDTGNLPAVDCQVCPGPLSEHHGL